MREIIAACCLFALFSTAYSLECYSCKDQDGNKDKCIKTSKQCEQNQDVCYSSVQWRIPPYWTPRGNRIHYLSKDCDTQERCLQRERETRRFCVRDWYLDWKCHECCSGDLCNYYVTLGSIRTKSSNLVLLTTGLITSLVCLRTLSWRQS